MRAQASHYARRVRRYIGHLPMVRLAPGLAQLRLDDGFLRHVPFDEWLLVDGSYPLLRDAYGRSAPLFLEIPVDAGPDPVVDRADLAAVRSAGMDYGHARANQLHIAMLLVTAARLASPRLSTAYLVIDEDLPSDLVTEPGPWVDYDQALAQRELIVFGEEYAWVVLDEEAVARIDRAQLAIAHCAQSGGSGSPAVLAVLRALTRTSRPGFGVLLEAMHLVAGLESLLVRTGEPLTATFARRYSVLAAEPDARSLEGPARALYELRSDLVHGRDVNLAKFGAATAGLPPGDQRQLTCTITLRALNWLNRSAESSIEALHRALDTAYTDSGAFSALRPVLNGVS